MGRFRRSLRGRLGSRLGSGSWGRNWGFWLCSSVLIKGHEAQFNMFVRSIVLVSVAVQLMFVVGVVVELVIGSVSVHFGDCLTVRFVINGPGVHGGTFGVLAVVEGFATVVHVLLVDVDLHVVRMVAEGQHLVCHVAVFDAVLRSSLDLVVELVVLVLDVVHQLGAAVVGHVVAVDITGVVAVVQRVVAEVLVSLVMVVVVVAAPLRTTLVVAGVLEVAGLVRGTLSAPILHMAVGVRVIVHLACVVRQCSMRVSPEELLVGGKRDAVVVLMVERVLEMRSHSIVDTVHAVVQVADAVVVFFGGILAVVVIVVVVVVMVVNDGNFEMNVVVVMLIDEVAVVVIVGVHLVVEEGLGAMHINWL